MDTPWKDWILVDPTKKYRARQIALHGRGHEENGKMAGSD
jgi:hypothetical protein